MARLGHVAIDSTRVRANASRHRTETVEELRQRVEKTRAEIRRWQQRCDAAGSDEEPGTELPAGSQAKLEEQLRETQQKLAQLEERGAQQISRTDPESRFLREAGGFALGYTADLAVSDDHLIVAQCTTQAASDSESLLPVVDQVKQNCGAWPQETSADSGFFPWRTWWGWKVGGLRATCQTRI